MNYYIYKDDRNIGPLAESEISEGLRSGKFLPKDLGCRVGETGWKDLDVLFPLEKARPTQTPWPDERQTMPPPGRTTWGSTNASQVHFQNPAPIVHQQFGRGAGLNPYANGDYCLAPRFGAMLIDALTSIPLMVIAVIPFLGIVGAPLVCLYMISRDSIFGGQSIGKRVCGLRVIKADGSPFLWVDSVKRNVVYFGLLVLMIPWVGYFLNAIINGPIGIVELIMILSGGQRIGDRMGDTYVVRV
jgi:uncharacterized RDD family membrane protein YckC